MKIIKSKSKNYLLKTNISKYNSNEAKQSQKNNNNQGQSWQNQPQSDRWEKSQNNNHKIESRKWINPKKSNSAKFPSSASTPNCKKINFTYPINNYCFQKNIKELENNSKEVFKTVYKRFEDINYKFFNKKGGL